MNFSSYEYNLAFNSILPQSLPTPSQFNFPVRTLDPYPIESFPSILKSVIVSLATDTNIPAEMIGSSLLAAVALALQPLINVLSPHSTEPEPCSLYMLTLALSGEGKTTLHKRIMKPFYMFSDEMKSEYQKRLAEYNKEYKRWNIKLKALESAFRQAIKNGGDGESEEDSLDSHFDSQPEKPAKFNLLYEDATPKAIITGLNEHPDAGIFSDEAVTFFNGYAKNNLGLLNRAWGGDPYLYQRPKEEDIEIRANLTIMLMAQPEIFIRYLNKHGHTAISSGFLPRFLITHAASTIGVRHSKLTHDDSDKHLNTFYIEIKKQLDLQKEVFHEIKPKKTTLTLSDEAKALFLQKNIAYQQNMQPTSPWEHIREFASKAGSNAIRIASIFHRMNNTGNIIDYKTLLDAYTIIEWHMGQADILLYPYSKNYQLELDIYTLFSWIKYRFTTPLRNFRSHSTVAETIDDYSQMPFSPFPKRDIETHGPNRLRRIDKLMPALNQLIAMGLIAIVRIPPSKSEYIVRCDRQGYLPPHLHGLEKVNYNIIADANNTPLIPLRLNSLAFAW